ncbi:uncharacterized protein [Narcine bancroftii]|uniref:uncharacterized protein isoform X7 n=1 Tax=Narcine bancroftii TaxID=1343680 RepID=UPI0038314DF4
MERSGRSMFRARTFYRDPLMPSHSIYPLRDISSNAMKLYFPQESFGAQISTFHGIRTSQCFQLKAAPLIELPSLTTGDDIFDSTCHCLVEIARVETIRDTLKQVCFMSMECKTKCVRACWVHVSCSNSPV